MSLDPGICTDVVTTMDVARPAATDVDTIWQLADNSISFIILK
jgi:hypothetical protein